MSAERDVPTSESSGTLSGNLLIPPAEKTFSAHLHWHLHINGTRPDGRPGAPGLIWEDRDFVIAIDKARGRQVKQRNRNEEPIKGDVAKNLRNWLNGRRRCYPYWLKLIEQVLFGANPAYVEWRVGFRDAHASQRRVEPHGNDHHYQEPDHPDRNVFPESSRDTAKIEKQLTGLPDEIITKLLEALDARRMAYGYEQDALERRTVIALAQRLTPNDALDFDSAINELEKAVAVALHVIAKGEASSYQDNFLNSVFSKLSEMTRSGLFDQASKTVNDALAEIDQRESDQLCALNKSRIALLEAGVDQAMLARDAICAANRVEAIAMIEFPADRPAWTPRFQVFHQQCEEEGHRRGINFSLLVAVELAERMCSSAVNDVERAAARMHRARALFYLGERETGTERLKQAVGELETTVTELAVANESRGCGLAHSALGLALTFLGERDSDPHKLRAAIVSFERAIKELHREEVPLEWATAQNNLGLALTYLDNLEGGTKQLHRALTAFEEALKERTQERRPIEWSTTQNNLGLALLGIGERDGPKQHLSEAVAAFLGALKEAPRDRFPVQWANIQHNLGCALLQLGKLEVGTGRLEEALVALDAALQERARDRVPLQWATTRSLIALALSKLGERESNTQRLQAAISTFNDALQELTQRRAPMRWAHAQNNLGNALLRLQHLDNTFDTFAEQIVAYRSALLEFSYEREPHLWATTQQQIGHALLQLWEKNKRQLNLIEEAITAFRSAQRGITRKRDEVQWRALQSELGTALHLLGRRENTTANVEASIICYQQVLKVLSQANEPVEWAASNMNLGFALLTLAQRTRSRIAVKKAILSFRDAMKELSPEHTPALWQAAQANLRVADELLAKFK